MITLPHPGELIREEVLKPSWIEMIEAAKPLGMASVSRSRVIDGRAGISSDLAMRLERAEVGIGRFKWRSTRATSLLEPCPQATQGQANPSDLEKTATRHRRRLLTAFREN